jgi:DNA mismatch repair protein MutS2
VQEAAELHKEIRQVTTELRKKKTSTKLEQARRSLNKVREEITKERWHPVAGEPPEDTGIIKVGDTVRIKEAGLTATVLSISETLQEVEVQAGKTKLRLGLHGVVKVAPTVDKFVPPPTKTPPTRHVPMELDLRGKRADEVEPALDAYLNDAARSNIIEARIIHGIATGTVRNIVREFLKNHPLVKSFRAGIHDEGGEGVTVVRF